MATKTTNMTAEDLWRMPEDGMRHELVKGELRTMAPAGSEHGAVVVKMTRQLANHVESHQLGVVFGAETGFILSRNPDLVRAPDVSLVIRSRVPEKMPKTYWPGAPDLAVEVLSPSDTAEEVEEKIGDYLDSGCSMVWIINPRRRTVSIHRPHSNPVILRDTDTLEGAEVVPGFACKVSQIFI